jgi:hypothetical protein
MKILLLLMLFGNVSQATTIAECEKLMDKINKFSEDMDKREKKKVDKVRHQQDIDTLFKMFDEYDKCLVDTKGKP